MAFLYEKLNTVSDHVACDNSRFSWIEDNLSSKFPIRTYQIKAFSRFDYFLKHPVENQAQKPFHLLYNMATGSGKTLVMAGLMLYLYEQGFRNFLFFVNSNNIIKKTQDNFLNPQSSKYLFKDKIVMNNQIVYLKKVNNFDEADRQNINIKFTTIQQLHSDLNNTKENGLTYEDFKEQKIVLIADEAHHLNTSTKSYHKVIDTITPTWENTVDKILNQNLENILLEFTATLDYKNTEIVKKYQNKIIFKYDLVEFRTDKYSKEINLIRSHFDQQKRIIQALILNLYRQELATANSINLKPVILFKAKKTIKESEQNKINFHHLIEAMSAELIDQIRNDTTISVVQKAFHFFDSQNLSSTEIAKRLEANFRFENCISANNDEEAEKNQLLLNSLEDENNPIRAVFAVQKLNEGWDVLNLFDIVRLYEGQTTGGSNTKIGTTTLAEAQLIGRGARYFPFALEEGQDKYLRKYDQDQANDLKILEELYYHTKEESQYISELKKALVESGIYENQDQLITKKLILKDEFKQSEFYLKAEVFFNKKIKKNYQKIKSFADLGVSRRNFAVTLSSGLGKMSSAFNKEEETGNEKTESKNIKLAEIPEHIIRFALSQNPFFYFENLINFFPHLTSMSQFISHENYLGNLEITFNGSKTKITNFNNKDFLFAVQKLLQNIETEIKVNLTEFEGSDYIKTFVREVFKDKDIKVYKDSERADGQEKLVKDASWYVYNANYGTSEEKNFVKLFNRLVQELEKKFDDLYLIRNERTLKIIDKFGRAFEPDFLLFCKPKVNQTPIYQIFIEPKGTYLSAGEQWKEDFLKAINFELNGYQIRGVPFYNAEKENEFTANLTSILNT